MNNSAFVPSLVQALSSTKGSSFTNPAVTERASAQLVAPATASNSSHRNAGVFTDITMKSSMKRTLERMRFKYGGPGSTSTATAVAVEGAEEEGVDHSYRKSQALDFGYEDFEKAMDTYNYKFQFGDKCIGRVYAYDNVGAIVDIGAKASAMCSLEELSIVPIENNPEDVIAIGEQREFEIISKEDQNGQLKLSLKRTEYRKAWERISQLQAEDVTVFADVISINRGGALIDLENIRGFLPGSHMSYSGPSEDLIGTKIPVKFLEVDQVQGRLVVSNRRAVAQQEMSSLEPGALIEGTVQSIKPYGAFVLIGRVPGLLHISQISHDHVDNIEKILTPGSPVKCMIINRDKDKGKISLSTKTLEPEPGDMVRNPQVVYERAEEMASRYHKRLEEERKAAADVADDIISTLDMASLDDLTADAEVDPVGASV